MVVFLLFIIACAVAPEAIINICRFLEWCMKVVGIIFGSIACLWLFGWFGYTIWNKLA